MSGNKTSCKCHLTDTVSTFLISVFPNPIWLICSNNYYFVYYVSNNYWQNDAVLFFL